VDSDSPVVLPQADTAVAQRAAFTTNDLPTVTHPCRKTACILGGIAGNLGLAGIIMLMVSGTNPAALAIGIITLLASGTIGIVALCMEFGSTYNRDNIRTLCTFCQEHHPREFERFIASPEFAEIATRDAGGCWSARQDGKDFNVLDVLVNWVTNSEVFLREERVGALNRLQTHTGTCATPCVSEKIIQICVKAGAIAPFQRALYSMDWRYHERSPSTINEAVKQIVNIICSIPSMPTSAQKEFLKDAYCEKALRHCLTDKDIASALLSEIERLEPSERLELLSPTNAGGSSLAMYIAESSKLQSLVPKLFSLIKEPKDLLSMLKYVGAKGNTFGTIICMCNSSSMAIYFLKYISKFSVEDRIEILSHRNADRWNIHNMIVKRHKNPRVSAAFFECLRDMNNDQWEECM
jgi:hypothetical protein